MKPIISIRDGLMDFGVYKSMYTVHEQQTRIHMYIIYTYREWKHYKKEMGATSV